MIYDVINFLWRQNPFHDYFQGNGFCQKLLNVKFPFDWYISWSLTKIFFSLIRRYYALSYLMFPKLCLYLPKILPNIILQEKYQKINIICKNYHTKIQNPIHFVTNFELINYLWHHSSLHDYFQCWNLTILCWNLTILFSWPQK